MKFCKFLSKTVLLFSLLELQVTAQLFDKVQGSGIAKPANSLGYEFQVWKEIKGLPHEMFGAHICGLGDVNGDGYNDFAVSTLTDTTFIFFGGKAFDQQPKSWVLGGGWALVSGDFNGDGYPDIATAEYNYKQRLDPKNKGKVRIYLHNRTPSMYDAQPSITITGKEYAGELGRGMIGGDVNGDGKTDLIIPAIGETPTNGYGRVYLYLGKEKLDTIPDHIFEDLHLPHGDWQAGLYGYAIAIGDLNGDKCDDLIIKGQEGNIKTSDLINNFVIWYGNKTATYTTPKYDMNSLQYPFMGWWVYSAKMFGNNFSLMFNNNITTNYDASIIFGKDTLSSILPDAIFPNPEQSFFVGATSMTQAGDLNNDGYQDYFISWWNVSVGGHSQYLYLGGNRWDTVAVAYFGLLDSRDDFSTWPTPLHDIDGDGIDDFGLDRWQGTVNWNGVRIYRGDNKIKRITNIESDVVTNPSSINVFPNPVCKSEENMVFIQGESKEAGEITLTLFDISGREVLREKRNVYNQGAFQFQLDVSRTTTGIYFVVVNSHTMREVKSISIIND